MSKYKKFLVAAAVPVLLAAFNAYQEVMGDGQVTTADWIAVIIAALGAAGVYAAKNEPMGDVEPPR